MKRIAYFICALLLMCGLYVSTTQAVSTLSSISIGTSPAAGSVLQTNGATSTWVATSSLGISSGSGSGSIGTSTSPVINTIPVWTSSTTLGNSIVTQATGTQDLALNVLNNQSSTGFAVSSSGVVMIPGLASNSNFYTDASGSLYAAPSAVSTAFVTVANSAVSSTLFSSSMVGTTTIPANTLRAGSVIKLSAGGSWGTKASVVGTASFYLIFAGNTFVSNVSTPAGSIANNAWQMICTITVQSAGASGVFTPDCLFTGSTPTVSTQDVFAIGGSTSSINTTTANSLDFQWMWGTASASNTITSAISNMVVNP